MEKPEQGAKFYYDANPFLGGWATNLNGRLAAVETFSKRGGAAWTAPGGGNAWTTMTFREMYSYSTGGLMQKKRLALSGQYSTGQPVASDFLESSYTFDSEGRMTGQVYPAAHELAGGVEVAGASYTYGFDNMGRPKTMAQSGASTLVSDVTYNAASQPLTITAGVGWVNSEARVYNALGQLTSLTNGTRRFEYDFSPTANDGRITTQRSYAGALQETITYTYDSLNRLSSAGQSGVWSAAYGYDGFGNLTNVTPTGTGPSAMNVAINPATNRVSGGGWAYDANGNATSMPGGFTGSYDVENRLLEANKNFAMPYGYGADNRRIYEVKRAQVFTNGDTTEEYVTWWSGQRIGKYKVRWDSTSVFVLARAEAESVYFGSKPLRLGAETNVVTDRLGSVRRDVRDYFPYGQERTTSYAGDQEKYGTYKHDAATDLSYADQRYYATGAGRFMSADPYKASAGAGEPGSWNRYGYVEGDPVNYRDPRGLESEGSSTPLCYPWCAMIDSWAQSLLADRIQHGARNSKAEGTEEDRAEYASENTTLNFRQHLIAGLDRLHADCKKVFDQKMMSTGRSLTAELSHLASSQGFLRVVQINTPSQWSLRMAGGYLRIQDPDYANRTVIEYAREAYGQFLQNAPAAWVFAGSSVVFITAAFWDDPTDLAVHESLHVAFESIGMAGGHTDLLDAFDIKPIAGLTPGQRLDKWLADGCK